MKVPQIILPSEGKTTINQDFIDFNESKNWSTERQIEVLWNIARNIIYEKSNLPEEKIEKSMQAFNGAYGLVKLKFQNIERNDKTRYFDHLIRVMKYLLINSKNPTIEKTIIAICHDLIEDTDISFVTIKEIFGTHIALGVLLISKKPIKKYLGKLRIKELTKEEIKKIKKSKVVNEYGIFISKKYLEKKYLHNKLTPEEIEAEELFIESKSDFELFDLIEMSGILNFKGLISDEFLQKKTYSQEKITVEEKWGEQLYYRLEKKYKDRRNSQYFSHMISENLNQKHEIISKNTPCLNEFYNYALSFTSVENLRIGLNKEEVKQVCYDALEVKFCDRIDNLKTTEVYKEYTEENITKAYRKIEETESYFYKIAQEFDKIMGTIFYQIIQSEVILLKQFLKDCEKDSRFAELYKNVINGTNMILDGNIIYEPFSEWNKRNY